MPAWIKQVIAALVSSLNQALGRTRGNERALVERAGEGALFGALVDNAADAVLMANLENKLTYVNRACCKLCSCDYDGREMIGLDLSALWPAGEVPFLNGVILPQAMADSWKGEVRLKRKGGRAESSSLFDANLVAFPLRNTEGQIIRIAMMVRDITESKRAEEALQQRNRELALLNLASQELISTLDLDRVLVTVLEEVRRLMSAIAATVWLTDPKTGELVCRQNIGPHSQFMRGLRLSPGEGVAGWVVRHGQSLLVPDAQVDRRHFKDVDQRTGVEIRSILCAPLRVKQDVIGVLQVVDEAANRFDATDLSLLESLAAPAAIAIENAKLYDQAQQEIAERVRAEAEIARLLEQARQDAETKAALLHEVNHRVKNNLASIVGFLALEQERAIWPEDQVQDVADSSTALRAGFQAMLEDMQNRIWGMLTVHEMLAATQWSPLSLSELVTQIIHGALSGSPIRHKIQVSVVPPPEPVRVVSKLATALALIVNELTTNSIKYAFQGRDQGCIEVKITTQGSPGYDRKGERVRLEFRDDGPGWPEDVLEGRRENVGLSLVRMSVRSPLRGEMALQNDGGAVIVITFDLASVD